MTKIKYIMEISLLNAALTLALFIPTIPVCMNMPTFSFHLLISVYGMLYMFAFLLLIGVLLPYREWNEANKEYNKTKHIYEQD